MYDDMVYGLNRYWTDVALIHSHRNYIGTTYRNIFMYHYTLSPEHRLA